MTIEFKSPFTKLYGVGYAKTKTKENPQNKAKQQ